MKDKTACFTGHRDIPPLKRPGIKHRLEREIERSIQAGYVYFGAGGALGFDTLAAQMVLKLKERYPDIKLMFYASETHDPIIDRESFEKVQALLQDRKERFSKSEQLNIYPLTSRIRCSECGSVFRRKVRNGAIKWVCARHSADTHACPSGYYSEERIYDGFITMVNKLRFGEERILDQVIAKLETAAALYKRNNISAGKMSQSIAELNAKLEFNDFSASSRYNSHRQSILMTR